MMKAVERRLMLSMGEALPPYLYTEISSLMVLIDEILTRLNQTICSSSNKEELELLQKLVAKTLLLPRIIDKDTSIERYLYDFEIAQTRVGNLAATVRMILNEVSDVLDDLGLQQDSFRGMTIICNPLDSIALLDQRFDGVIRKLLNADQPHPLPCFRAFRGVPVIGRHKDEKQIVELLVSSDQYQHQPNAVLPILGDSGLVMLDDLMSII